MITTVTITMDADWVDFLKFMDMNEFDFDRDENGSYFLYGEQDVHFDVEHDQYGIVDKVSAYTDKEYKQLSSDQVNQIMSIIQDQLNEDGYCYPSDKQEHGTY